MINEFALVPSRRTIRRLDIAAAATVAGFVALGLFVGWQLWNLAQLHRGLLDVATALDSTAQAIGLVSGAPFIGGGARQFAADVTAAAGDVRANAALIRDGTRAVAVGVAATIALLAVVPVAVLYLPLRVARRRELRGLARLLAAPADPMLIEHLARTGVRRVPYSELRRVSRSPWRDLERGHHVHLAAAELRRLGLPVPDWSAAASPEAGSPEAGSPEPSWAEPATDPGLRRVQPPAGRRDG